MAPQFCVQKSKLTSGVGLICTTDSFQRKHITKYAGKKIITKDRNGKRIREYPTGEYVMCLDHVQGYWFDLKNPTRMNSRIIFTASTSIVPIL